MPMLSANAPSFLLFVWIAFTFLGSWYPFAFQMEDVWNALSFWLISIHHYKPKTDILINTVLGLPLGVLSYACIVRSRNQNQRSHLAAFLQLIVGILVCLFVACFVEIGQYFFAGRDPSIWDSVCQVCGSIIGIMVGALGYFDLEGWIAMVDSLYRQLDPTERILGFLVLVFIIYQLWPVIPTLSPSELKQKIREFLLTIDFCSLRNTLTHLRLFSFPQGLILFVLSAISGFFIGRIGERIFRFPRFPSWFIALTLAPSLEVAKLLIEDRMPSVAALGLCFMGSIIGRFAMFMMPNK